MWTKKHHRPCWITKKVVSDISMEGKSWFSLKDESEKNVSQGFSLNVNTSIFYQTMCQNLSYLKTSCAYIYSLLKVDPQRHKSVCLPLKSTFKPKNYFLECVWEGDFMVGNRKKMYFSDESGRSGENYSADMYVKVCNLLIWVFS